MGAKQSGAKTGAKAGAAVDELREDMGREFGGAHEVTGQMAESMRSRPARWAAPIGTLAVAAAATIGVMKWRRDRRTPQSRAKRAWRSMQNRFGR
jgi:hypothetical protein